MPSWHSTTHSGSNLPTPNPHSPTPSPLLRLPPPASASAALSPGAAMDQIASRRSSPSYLAFSPELHYLAAGSASKKGAVDELLLFSACEGAVGVDFRCEGEFGLSSPACRISWSFPFGDRSMGLVSAGLEDGSVAVYDPRPHDDWAYGRFDDDVLLLRDGKPPPFFVCNSSSKIDVVRGDVVDGDWEFIEKPKPEEEESTWEIVGSENLIASFSDHTAPVRGLVFSPHMPSVLASGAESGTVRLFDVSHLSGEVVPSLVVGSNSCGKISCITWDPFDAPTFAICSVDDISAIWDVRTPAGIIASIGSEHGYSFVEWNPKERGFLVTAPQENTSNAAIKLWDTRKLANPVLSFCMNSGGVGTMAWSSHNNSILMTSTNSDKLTFWNIDGINKKVQVIQEFDSPGICFDAQWSRAGVLALSFDDSICLYR